MRLKNVPGCRERIAESEYVVPEEELTARAGSWKSSFERPGELHIEIGMGKGRFIHEMAMLHPDINYIGIEKYSAVLLRAVQKMEEEPKENLKFIRMDAEIIADVFGPGEVDRIYLNFSDPWPKDRHAKRRLPSREFLARYDRILRADGRIEFKTDNRVLFDWAVEQLPESGWKADLITYDLHADDELVKDNVMTEYEEKFSSMGNPICKYIISRE
ncbi:MAG: tRNA (guanosine(46)-N7)-methyltransferase TrmB [Lachnospiraceae bacterium]|nr:tRNA (guanosine(46)-N7)-methyltransferase TrmB [Lachnospiraceae bacterium]